jgi:hypothetical protein
MPYIITTTAGATLTTVADDVVNTTSTSLSLIGKNYAGYGIFLNENFISLLENFNNSTPPAAPLTGQIWYDNFASLLKFYTGAAWKPISTSTASAVPPSNPIVGDLWWNTLTSQLNVRGPSNWVIIGPAFSSVAGTSGAIIETILDSVLLGHVVVSFYISNTVIAILSKDSPFIPQVAIPGFPTINPGLNLISSAVLPSSQFWGNSVSAGSVSGVSLTNFLRSDQASSNGTNTLTVGKLQASTHLLIDPTPADVQIYSNSPGTSKDIGIYVNRGGTPTLTQRSIATTGGTQFYANLTTVNVNPTSDNVSVIGSGTTRYANVHSVSFTGTNLFGTIRTAAQPNITSVGTLTSLAVTGAVSASSLTGTIQTAAQPNITSVGTLGSLTVTGNVSSANLVSSFGLWGTVRTASQPNITSVGTLGSLAVTGNVSASNLVSSFGLWGTVRTPAQTNITSVGTLGSLTVSGAVTVNSTNAVTAIVNGGTSGVGNIGTAANPFNTIFARATSAQYADLAERFETDTPLLPGTVVELGGVKEITQAVQELSEEVFGVISTLPGFLLNGNAGTDVTHPPIAVNGRVPVRVIGTCKKGDRLVSAGRGLARAARRSELTAFNVIGRALQDKITSDEGLVEAIVKLNS